MNCPTRHLSRFLIALAAGLGACEPRAVDGTRAADTAPNKPQQASPQAPPPPSGTLDRKLYDKAQKFAPGMRPSGPAFGGELEQGQRREQLLVVRFGRCYRLVGVGGPEVEDLDLVLFDDDNVQVQRDFGQDPYPVLGMRSEICPKSHGAYRVQVSMFKGRGSYRVRAYEVGD